VQQLEPDGHPSAQRTAALLARLEQAERQLEAERRRTDQLLSYLSHRDLALARIEQLCTRIEAASSAGSTSHTGGLSPVQWLKILIGLALPLLVLLLTGNVELARKLIVP
jgi:hypothetical protein